MSKFINLDGNLISMVGLSLIGKPRYCKYDEEWTIRVEGIGNRDTALRTKDQAEAMEWHSKLVEKVLQREEDRRIKREAR